MAPIRIQRRRTKGWKMPENTIYVGRPTVYGNPFKVDETYKILITEDIIAWGQALSFVKGDPILIKDNQHAVEMYEKYLRGNPMPEYLLKEIRGKNLACFCALDKPCHADILLKLANE